MELLDTLFGAGPVNAIFADRGCVQRMLDFEAALARAEAKVGIIPRAAVAPVAAKCQADLFDLKVLAQDARKAGNLAIPLVKQLTALVRNDHAEAARYVHWGATSQDVIDTGMVLQLRDAFVWIEEQVNGICSEAGRLADEHRSSVMAGRTWMQQAVPIVFGLKAAGWLDAMVRHRARLEEVRRRSLVLQFGGAAGTLATLEGRGVDVAHALAEELGLELPAMPWHANRDRVAEVATTLALLTGTLGKIARDISLQMQTEVGEVAEPSGEGRGGSSTMPQKRNPVRCAAVLAAAERVPGLTSTMLGAMTQESERGLGGWHAEWETLPEIVRLFAGALEMTRETLAGLEVDVRRMRQNLGVTHGLVFAEAVSMVLARKIGKSAAHEILEAASQKAVEEKKHLREVVTKDPRAAEHLSEAELEQLFDPAQQLGVAEQWIDRVLTASQERSPGSK
jgi:3-carboxy-cis,cis-muconate cycloisomerase